VSLFWVKEDEFFGSYMISSKVWGNHSSSREEEILICILDYSHGLFFIWFKNTLFSPAPALPQHRLSKLFCCSKVRQVRR